MVAGAGDAPPRENVGFAESPDGVKRDGACALDVVLVAGAAAPKSGLGVLSAVVIEVFDTAGLFELPNIPVLGAGAAGVVPNRGLAALAPEPAPNRPPVGCDCEVTGVVEDGAVVEGVVEELVFSPPKILGVFDPGGGPAGVVDVLPNKEAPVCAGVADEPAFPNRLPPAAADPPNSVFPPLWLGVVESVLPGV